MDVVHFAAHQAGTGEDHPVVWFERRRVDRDVFFARMCRRYSEHPAAGVTRAVRGGVGEARAGSRLPSRSLARRCASQRIRSENCSGAKSPPAEPMTPI